MKKEAKELTLRLTFTVRLTEETSQLLLNDLTAAIEPFSVRGTPACVEKWNANDPMRPTPETVPYPIIHTR